MIKFFRKIRQNLLSENKTGKYFKYALGEIILVVIGILIALQINNWNQNRITQNNQEKYLLLLKNETLNNLNELKSAQNTIQSITNGQQKLIRLIDSNLDTISENYFSKVMFEAFGSVPRFDFENSVLSELKISGEIKNIKNDSIRRKIVALEPLVKSVADSEKFVIDMFLVTSEIILENGSVRTWYDSIDFNEYVKIEKGKKSVSNIPILKSNKFENYLLRYMGPSANLRGNIYAKLEKHLNSLIELIDKELKALE
ncbi:hypothetical protein C1T31_04625 [Hanstruepera neustonica]|uniref:Uncharacterized protein n=1 Tax=Hanstruepera neustonica TaxID=1445657 RepID=A0A2K1E027_9FLAO|nr:DUF6090 family protein [Hanstruepera neustonica]PNQ73628.1 hypothetical protein C1T31_04625 [Hanstruepera neustonica]